MPLVPLWVQPALTLVILAVALVSFVREKLPPDLTALLALLSLMLTGVLTPAEAFAGFSHPATVSIAAMLVLTAGLERTGALTWLARHLIEPLRASEFLLTLVLMAVIGVLSAFIANTAAVSVFIPVVLDVCRRTGHSPGRILMPMSHAATLGGMCTLIGTSTNLAAHEYARSNGLPGYAMFELSLVGLPVLLLGFAYVLFIGRRFLPHTRVEEVTHVRSGPYVAELVVQPGSPWIGREIRRDRLRRGSGLDLAEVLRGGERLQLEPGTAWQEGDRLQVQGPLDRVLALAAREGLEVPKPRQRFETPGADLAAAPSALRGEEEAALPMVELVVLPSSPLIGRTLGRSRFQERYNVAVLALHRPGGAVEEPPLTTPLHGGDVLVTRGDSAALRELGEVRGFLVVGAPEHPGERPEKLWIALATMAGVIVAASLGWLPIVIAATAGSAVLVLTGCLRPREAYQAINWSVIVLLAGALALGTALQKTGLTADFAAALGQLPGVAGSFAVLAAFYVAAMVLSEVMSNSGTVLLLAPVAVATAGHLGLNPMAMMAAVTFGASSAFALPIGYQTSLMIYGPGGYRFSDFLRMGLPLDLIATGLSLWLIPRFWPLQLP